MDENPKTSFETTVRAVGEDVAEALDGAVNQTTRFLAGESGNPMIGGAVVGALAAVALPFSLLTGALLGAGYAFLRKSNR